MNIETRKSPDSTSEMTIGDVSMTYGEYDVLLNVLGRHVSTSEPFPWEELEGIDNNQLKVAAVARSMGNHLLHLADSIETPKE